MAIEVEKLVFAAEAELKAFEREMNRIPAITEEVSRQAQQKAVKYAKANEQVQHRLAEATIKEQKRISTEVLRELDRRNRAQAKATQPGRSKSGGGFMASFAGNTASIAVSAMANEAKDLAIEGVKLNASFDKLARFTATLDKNFQTPEGLKRLKTDIQQLSTEIPQSADDIAKASFTMKSAFQQLTQPELTQFLREFGLAATASNTDIASHTEHVAALAKQYGITAKDLRQFNAMIASSFGQALASDAQVAEGFNRIVNSAKATKQPLDVIIASMSTLQGASNDAAGNTTLLENVLGKLSDGKYQAGFHAIGVEVFDASGNFRTLVDLSNDLAKSIDGMSDAEISRKLEFLKDKESRDGFLALARNAKALNEQLKNGADLDAYANKTKIMLESTDAQWKLFWAKVENGQRAFGERIAKIANAGMNQTSTTNAVLAVSESLGTEMESATYSLVEQIALAGQDLRGAFTTALNNVIGGIDPAQLETEIAKDRESITAYFAAMQTQIQREGEETANAAMQSQKEHWEKILVSPLADESLKAKARQNLETLNTSIQANFASTANANFESWKKIGEKAVEGLKSADPALKNQARQTISNLNQELVKASSDSKYSAEMQKNIRALWQSLPAVSVLEINAAKPQISNAVSSLFQINPVMAQNSGFQIGNTFIQTLNQSIEAGKGAVKQSQNSLFAQPNTTFVTSSGFRIGTNLWQGVVQGINSGRGSVQAASASLGNWAESGMRGAIESHSPSEVFARLGADTVDGYILGINRNAGKVKDTLKKNITQQVKDLKKELKDALDEFKANIAGYGRTSETRSNLFSVNQAKSDFDSLINLRHELGMNVNKPIIIGDISRELRDLEKLKENLSGLSSVVDEFWKDDSASKKFSHGLALLNNSSSTEGFRKIAEAAGKTTAQFTVLAREAMTAEFLNNIAKTNDEFEQMADPAVTAALEARAAALQKIQDAISAAPESQREAVTAGFGIKPGVLADDGELPPEFKKMRTEFEGLSDFLNQSFTDLRERGWRGMLAGMVTDLADALQQMFVKWITSQIFKAFGQSPPTSGPGSSAGGGFWSKLLGFAIGAVGSAFGGGGGGALTSPLRAVHAASGGWFNPVQGGIFTNLAEGGYPEAVLSTNPIFRERSARIAHRFQNQVSIAPSYNFPKNYQSNIEAERAKNNEGGSNVTNINNFSFHANEKTGAFSQSSAQQAAKHLAELQQRTVRRNS